MQYTKARPTREQVWVEVEALPGGAKRYQLYVTVPEPLGEARFETKRRWVSDDGLVFASSMDVATYYQRRDEAASKTIPPGEYTLDIESVTQGSGRVVVRLRDGREVVLRSK